MAISLIPFDRLDFRTFGYPQNGTPFSPPILRSRSGWRGEGLSSEGEPERMSGRADSIGRTYQDDSEQSSRRKANEAETVEPTGS